MNWGDVIRRLRDLGSTNWYAATREARQCGCTADQAMRIIAYGRQQRRSLAAIQCRLAKARPSLDITDGWSDEPVPEAYMDVATGKPIDNAHRERLEAEATYVIRTMRRAGHDEPAIRAKLAELRLEWPR